LNRQGAKKVRIGTTAETGRSWGLTLYLGRFTWDAVSETPYLKRFTWDAFV